jgi:hypothetical protein
VNPPGPQGGQIPAIGCPLLDVGNVAVASRDILGPVILLTGLFILKTRINSGFFSYPIFTTF